MMGSTVLIVEDEILVALQLEDILSEAGHHVVGIVPDREGLGTIPDPPQVALVDLNLRDGLTGPSIAHKLSEIFGTKIVYVTANPGQIGDPAPTAIGVVQKPFSQAAILAAMALAMGRTEERLPPELEPIAQAA
jgi:two-component system, response regulator PdtaR